MLRRGVCLSRIVLYTRDGSPFVHREIALKEMSFTPVPDTQFAVDYPERGVMHLDHTKAWTGGQPKAYPTTAPLVAPKPVSSYQPLADVPAVSKPIIHNSTSA